MYNKGVKTHPYFFGSQSKQFQIYIVLVYKSKECSLTIHLLLIIKEIHYENYNHT